MPHHHKLRQHLVLLDVQATAKYRFGMASIPSKVANRIVAGLKTFQPVVSSAKARDVNESDTVIIITDMLSEIFGYDKYSDITSEHIIRSTYCDLAVKLDGAIQALIEVKAVGLDLKEQYVKQAIDYASDQGVDWVVLTNGSLWRIYNVIFEKPVNMELVTEIDFCALNPKNDRDVELLYLLSKEGWVKSALGDYHTQRQALSRFYIGATVVSEPIVTAIRRQLRQLSPDVRIDVEQIRAVLSQEVIKREVMEGEKADAARKKIARISSSSVRAKTAKQSHEVSSS